VGPSGSGKTTIVRLILRMYDADVGAVRVDDINVKSLVQQSLRSNIGVVAQDTVLFHASLRDNVSCVRYWNEYKASLTQLYHLASCR
jgi:ABC-type multidrug transport system fused ATPase/permease subunit